MKNELPQKIIQSIIRQRKYLIKSNVSGKNNSVCLAIIKQIELYVEAYGKKYDLDGWKKFIQRNYNDLLFLIPENKSGNSIKLKLNQYL